MRSKRVINRNEDILQSNTTEKFDLIIGVDIVTQIIAPLSDSAERDYFMWIYSHLKSDGCVYLEFLDYSYSLAELKGKGEKTEWEEFPHEDPFQYGLYKDYIDGDGNLVREKKFFERKAKEFSSFKNVIRSYTSDEIRAIMELYGFDVNVYDSPEVVKEMDISDAEMNEWPFYVVAKKK